ncbi:hypothetical protein RHMOL_Rhmol12G0037700 [Rhododendron molle]|uniref:Uncharacterized protein n=1 Tax=Rhododendron molle TaxID=49168 RepID=A0ACC0LDW4_RHOML|nr:hypothetical protein RHMOL_Rhmol12G0037700 [Rhododendron molle]
MACLGRILGREEREDLQSDDEVTIDANEDYETFANRGLGLLNPEVLYKTGFWTSRTGFIRHHREVQVSCLANDVVNLDLIDKESTRTLVRNKEHRFMHLGLVVIGIKGKGLVRKELGRKTLVSLYDGRFINASDAMIGVTEVDMNENKGIFCCRPGFFMTIEDFSNHAVKIGIQTKGYEDMKEGENLSVCIGFIGTCLTSCAVKYKLRKIKEVVDRMGSKGIKMIRPLKLISAEELAGLGWDIEKFVERNSDSVPEQASSDI